MTISIIGAGNVAHLLGKAFFRAGHQIHQIYNRNYSKAKSLALDLQGTAIKDISDLDINVEMILIAVSDDAISIVADNLFRLELENTLVTHTSGSVSMQTLDGYKHHGVFYPFQTMTALEEMDFQNVPILISGSSESVEIKLMALANSLSSIVQTIKDHQRKVIHLAGVFANNFSNHMFVIASDILEKENIPFEIIRPLIEQTVSKLRQISPQGSQTGPAIRKDYKTIQSHLEWLDSNPQFLEIYKLLTKSIIDRSSPGSSSNFSV